MKELSSRIVSALRTNSFYLDRCCNQAIALIDPRPAAGARGFSVIGILRQLAQSAPRPCQPSPIHLWKLSSNVHQGLHMANGSVNLSSFGTRRVSEIRGCPRSFQNTLCSIQHSWSAVHLRAAQSNGPVRPQPVQELERL